MRIVALLFGLLLGLAFVPQASAQATRTWVSGVGDDVNPCSRTAPCKTFAGAISKTAVNGEINCLDAGGFGGVTITKSITLDCSTTFGSILTPLTNGILVNFDSFQGTDVRKTVRLRGLLINGASTGLNGIRIIGGAAALGSGVFIEDVVIDGMFGTPGRGIADDRTGGGELSVLDTTVRNTGEVCIAVQAGTARKDVIIDNVSVGNCGFGFFAGNNVKAMISNSTFSLSTQSGIQVASGAEVMINDSTITSNGTGISNNGTMRLANTDITLNSTGITGGTQSYGNNRLVGNSVLGAAPTPLGGVSTTFSQQ